MCKYLIEINKYIMYFVKIKAKKKHYLCYAHGQWCKLPEVIRADICCKPRKHIILCIEQVISRQQKL